MKTIKNNPVHDKEFLSFVENSRRNTGEYNLLFKVLPDIINYLYWIHSTKTGPLCFISRDGYFLKILYDSLFPNEKTFYVYCSRKALYTGSKTYVSYIKQFYDLNANWVDIDGSNRSHYAFFKKNFNQIPTKYIFIYDAPFFGTPNQTNVKYYTHNHDNNLTKLLHELTYTGMGKIENLFRAPHRSIIDVKYENNTYVPVFESIHDARREEHSFNKYVKHLFNDYITLQKLIKKNRFLFREEPLLRENYRKKSNNKFRGIVALDLDGTTDCKGIMKDISSAVKHLKKLNYKVIIITARLDPMEIDLNSMGLPEGCDIYYNTNRYNPALTKALQLERAHLLEGFSETDKYRSFLIDNDRRNIDSVKNFGFSGILTHCNNFKKDIFNIFPKNIKKYHNKSKNYLSGKKEESNIYKSNNYPYYHSPNRHYPPSVNLNFSNKKKNALDEWD